MSTNLSVIKKVYYFLKQNVVDVVSHNKCIAKAIYFPLPYIHSTTEPNIILRFEHNLLSAVTTRNLRKDDIVSVMMEGNANS